ncbi:arylacetamide deacetylase-like 4 [Anolis carolinensis]|uniref:Alpha/beta hydrolase fold-3 domain-containing protein n=1 Tax=Anolis carolinensis TaxID=28377 RepID=A0A803TEP9_ANOCA|nr:PREDICTED: arylacetamide deacetylase-like 3 [Anolis carolinensis]|eukprot:XP_003230097.1 PREDICTED: arylacetamide deacetylase-like 3 [Anolis carolinensis]
MELAWSLWALARSLGAWALCGLFARAVYYNLTRTHLPPGIKQRNRVRWMTLLMNVLLALALGIEKLGICSRYKIWRLVMNGIPPLGDSGLVIKDLRFDGVPVRMYQSKSRPSEKSRAIVYIPGGVGLLGSISAYERVCRYIARESGFVVVSVGYRLAPEHLYPVPLLDCCTAVIHFLKHAADYGVDPDHVTVGGDSSGGTFATAVCQRLTARKDLPRIRAQALLYPFLQAVDFNLPSYQQNCSIPPLFKKRAVKLGLMYLMGTSEHVGYLMKNAHMTRDLQAKYQKWISADHIPDEFKARGYVPAEPSPFCEALPPFCTKGLDPMFSPLLAEDETLRQLPEAFLLTCEYDVVRDDGLLYKKRLEDNGVPVTWCHVKDGFHGIAFFVDYGPFDLQISRSTLNHLIQFLEDL